MPKAVARLESIAVCAVFLAATAAVFLTAPTAGDFSWSDAPRHALNGVFVRDLVYEHPLRDPSGWAVRYYLQYPAITILFYPPLFYAVESVLFAAFGFSHAAAQATVALFALALLGSAYGVARMWLPRWSAAAAALLVLGAPQVMYWARQVMLDVPAYAAVVTSAFLFLRYLRQGSTPSLYLASIAAVAATWIKLTSVFMLPVLLVLGAATLGTKLVTNRHLWGAALLGALGLTVPVFLTLRFGAVNVQSVAGRPGDISRLNPAAWLFYGRLLPEYVGVLVLALAALGTVMLLTRLKSRDDRLLAMTAACWFSFGYLFFSFIGVREPRHGLMMLLPLALMAVWALHAVLPSRPAQAFAMILAVGVFSHSVLYAPPPVVEGYPTVVNAVLAQTPRGGLVLFFGRWDGNFVFNMRTHEERRDVSTVRVDKLLVEVAAGERVRGVKEAGYSRAQVESLIRDLGADLVVVEPGFWDDIPQMALFVDVIRRGPFERVEAFDIDATLPYQRHRIEIYRPTYPVVHTKRQLELNMPMVGDRFVGEVPGR